MNKEVKLICIAKEGVDYTKYGFRLENRVWSYWYNNTRRIYFDVRNNKVYFNCMTTQVLSVFYRMAQDNVIEFKECLKEHRMYLTDEEYKIIQEMRGKKND